MDALLINFSMLFILLANFLFVLFILCIERKNPSLALSWILALIFLPIIGFVLYLLFGTNIVIRKKKTLEMKRQQDFYYHLSTLTRVRLTADQRLPTEQFAYKKMVNFNGELNKCPCTFHNDVQIFITAKEKYLQLLKDIKQAKQSIHLLYFIIRNDKIGRKIVAALAEKAKAGVKVRLLYDHAGCMLTPSKTFAPIIACGGEVKRFFPISVSNYLRVNFRNHRKIAVIDSRIGYLGGMNIGDEYMGLSVEHSPWRDTHLRIQGESVHFLQERFIEDWLFACNYRKVEEFADIKKFFPPIQTTTITPMQIVASGPDTSEEEIKWNFMQLLSLAKSAVYIQTPYFVPDESFLEAIKITVLSGIKVIIMIPNKTDNLIVHKVSLSYLGELLHYGVEAYLYSGFLHAKMMFIDESIATIGSANMDMRSFALNFEINAFFYDAVFTNRCKKIFFEDMKNARPFTLADYQQRNLGERMLDGVFRLLAPLL